MIVKKTSIILFFIIIGMIVFGQEDKDYKKQKVNYSTFGIGAGMLTYYGDYMKEGSILSLNNFKSGYSFIYEERLSNFLGVSLMGLYGNISANDDSKDHYNFKSQLVQGGLNLHFHIDNGTILKANAMIAPYFTIGVGYIEFEPKGDLLDKNGNKYYYWEDGSIRNVAEGSSDSSYIIARDYNFETKLSDPKVKYQKNTVVFPCSFGTKLKLSKSFDLDLSYYYVFTNTDYLDNVAENGNYDNYGYFNFSLNYKIGGYKNQNQNSKYLISDFKEMQQIDTDRDGIVDDEDMCPATKRSVFVDSKGCPLDDDKDGVPDYLDKEPNSPKNSIVDINGVTITEEAMQKSIENKVAKRNAIVKTEENGYKLADITMFIDPAKASVIPLEFATADLNNDGYISPSEIHELIDAFFDGENFLTVKKINNIIDYFFEQ